LLKKKLSIKAVAGLIQTILALSAITIAFILKFNPLNVQSQLNVPIDDLNFYFLLLLTLGVVSILSGAFLIYDWWET
jgi:hypothetical protein